MYDDTVRIYIRYVTVYRGAVSPRLLAALGRPTAKLSVSRIDSGAGNFPTRCRRFFCPLRILISQSNIQYTITLLYTILLYLAYIYTLILLSFPFLLYDHAL